MVSATAVRHCSCSTWPLANQLIGFCFRGPISCSTRPRFNISCLIDNQAHPSALCRHFFTDALATRRLATGRAFLSRSLSISLPCIHGALWCSVLEHSERKRVVVVVFFFIFCLLQCPSRAITALAPSVVDLFFRKFIF